MLGGLVLLLAGAVVFEYERTPIPTGVSAAALAQSSQVYFSDGQLVGTFSSGINRQVLTSAQIPPVLREAVVAAEDRHFYTEGGISLTGLGRAAYEDLFGSGGLQGGSTLTEQFVKNYYASIGPARTMGVKVREIIVAVKLARTRSKNWIMTQYLNTVYLGADSYGVGAAARTYFNEPAGQLDLAQAAMLAAMVNQPGYFLPGPDAGAPYRALLARWRYVLTNMVRDGAISAATAAAQRFPRVAAHPNGDASWDGYRGYLMQMVEQELESTYGMSAQRIFTGGLHVTTTFSQSLTSSLYRVIRAGYGRISRGRGAVPPADQIGAVVERPDTGAIVAVYGGAGYGARHCAALHCLYNLAEAPNEVGSGIQPYLLAAAVRRAKAGPAESAAAPAALGAQAAAAAKTAGFPLTYLSGGQASVASPVWRTLAPDVVAAARALGVGQDPFTLGGSDLTGLGAVLRRRAHHDQPPPPEQASLTPVEQAGALATLADAGVYHAPHVIARLEQGGTAIPLRVARHRVLSPGQAVAVDGALSGGDPVFESEASGTIGAALAVPGNFGSGAGAPYWFSEAGPDYSMSIGLFGGSQSGSLLPTAIGKTFQAQAAGQGGLPPVAVPGW
ncbi:MAG TPA: transglycosylase domain-containing protein [Streptosporangiaceae bacterium]|nr:transglycosylase domain-containing protein [Streptosporangiaceae bacterium]